MIDKVKDIILDHLILVITIVFFLIMLIIGTSVRGSAKKAYMDVASQLNDVQNTIEHNNMDITQNTKKVVTGLVGGLSKQRWASDDVIITEWIYPAFNFNSSDEYNANRDIYVQRLGAANDFVLEVMPPYIAGYMSREDESATIDDGTGINMAMTGFTSYVDGIDGDVYSYVAIASCSSTRSSGETVTSDLILTYSINGNGDVLNFRASTPYNP